MLTRRDPNGYNMVEIEMILNYFPHTIWAGADDLKTLRDEFYQPILDGVINHTDSIDNRQFLSIFQGLNLAGPRILTEKVLNLFLNEYVKRL